MPQECFGNKPEHHGDLLLWSISLHRGWKHGSLESHSERQSLPLALSYPLTMIASITIASITTAVKTGSEALEVDLSASTQL
jgi:hypothetical protein